MKFVAAVSAAAVSLLGLAQAAPSAPAGSVWDRSLAITYALEGGKGMNYSDAELLNYFKQVSPPITAMVPFLLNVGNPGQYASIIKTLKGQGTIIVPAVGKPANQGNIDSANFKAIAKGYAPYSTYIRLEGIQGYYDTFGAAGIQNMIDYCNSQGFDHVMLNPWPVDKNHNAVKFTGRGVDSTILQVSLHQNRKTSEPIPDPMNWYPSNPNKIKAIRAAQPGCDILINYESATQLLVLDNLERKKKGSSINAMEITINQIEGPDKAEDLHWTPPFDQVYDPVKEGTWNWMAGELSKM